MLQYLRQQSSFWIAVMTVFAFVAGNMVGEHGWYAFWKAVLGGLDDAEIVYQGAVTPIELVPDYRKWSPSGTSTDANTYRQVPTELLVPLPVYSASALKSTDSTNLARLVYSVGYLGSYTTGYEGDGSHPAVDIRVPEGTPVRGIMNGIVQTAKDDSDGFGKYVVIRHPNVPDPSDPSKTTTLYSSYAHLSSVEVSEGQIVRIGERIGLSGMTGDATGPHLHFQVDGASAPFHPYWPFTSAEARAAGKSTFTAVNSGFDQDRAKQYTVSPLAYIQGHLADSALVRQSGSSSSTIASSSSSRMVLSAAILRQQRLTARLARRQVIDTIVGRPLVSLSLPSTLVTEPEETSADDSSTSSATSSVKVTVSTEPGTTVAGIRFDHDGAYAGRQWENLHITLLDANGNTIQGPAILSAPLHLVVDYGKADFDHNDLTATDFTNGEADVKFLPRGQRTIVIRATAFNTQSRPMPFEP